MHPGDLRQHRSDSWHRFDVLELGALGLLESVCSPIGSVQDVLEICLIGHSLESLADRSRK